MVAAAVSFASSGLALRQKQRANVRRTQQRMVVRAQATAAPAVEFKGEIKDKTAELAINGGRRGRRNAPHTAQWWRRPRRRRCRRKAAPACAAHSRTAQSLLNVRFPLLPLCCCSHPLPGHRRCEQGEWPQQIMLQRGIHCAAACS